MLDENAIRAALRQVSDPEIGINIVDLGLIYRITLKPEAVEVDMTTTSPACPMGAMLVEEAEAALSNILPPGYRVDVRRVWEPPWTPERMSDSARVCLGW
ncbi:MAG: metal-sulfur cluster assembly factor [Azoarcus sp.]|jgi:metal-sulfur cluster biosynthetic enzyme|nr:metal-sulfur cluster assembly factor [Azoarcus sp.]